MARRASQVSVAAAAGFTMMMLAVPAAHATATTGSAAGFSMDLGPASQAIPGCPVSVGQDLNLVWDDGNLVEHGSSNKNGDWGGSTAEGTVEFQVDGTTLFTGHGTFWGGGGNNKAGQSEGGFTLDFHGTGADGSLSLHVDGHMTTNNAGTPTANVMHVAASCS
jgi:hypothetical protein